MVPLNTGSTVVQNIYRLQYLSKFSYLILYSIAACSNGWKKYKNNCYKKFPPASWDNAKDYGCVKEGATLADVKNVEENNFIQNTFGEGVWLGLSRCHTDSTCLLDFSEAKFTHWQTGEPDKQPQSPAGLANEEFAVLMGPNGKWNDNPKFEVHPYICKKPGTAFVIDC